MPNVAEEAAIIGMFAVVPIIHTPTITTLYALIETLQDQVVPEADAAVTAVVARLCNMEDVSKQIFRVLSGSVLTA
jgi:hypothetical protein